MKPCDRAALRQVVATALFVLGLFALLLLPVGLIGLGLGYGPTVIVSFMAWVVPVMLLMVLRGGRSKRPNRRVLAGPMTLSLIFFGAAVILFVVGPNQGESLQRWGWLVLTFPALFFLSLAVIGTGRGHPRTKRASTSDRRRPAERRRGSIRL